MPFIRSKLIVEEVSPVTIDENSGQTIGQLVDMALVEMLDNMPPNSVPQSIEFGFDGEGDFGAFMRVYSPAIDAMRGSSRKSRKATSTDY